MIASVGRQSRKHVIMIIVLGDVFMAVLYMNIIVPAAMMLAVFVQPGSGNALFQSPNNTEVMKTFSKEKTAIAPSVPATLRNLGMTLGVSSASILLMPQLKHSGYQGSIVDADPTILANVIGNVLFISSLLCFLTMILLLGKREGSFHGKSRKKGDLRQPGLRHSIK